MATARLTDTRLEYTLDGAPDAPVLVLSHGLGLALGMWDAQVPALAERFRVLRYDTRGHGASSLPIGPSTLDDLGHDVVELLDYLHIERAHFCGLSLGGMTGMWLAIHAPQRVASLVLANTAAHVGTREMWDARIATVNARGMSTVSDAAIERWFTPAFVARSPRTVAALKAMFERTPANGYVSCCAANRNADLRNAVARIRAPTLVITGRHDVATPPAQGEWLARQIAGARCVELPTAHLSNLEKPDAFSALVADHVANAIAASRAQPPYIMDKLHVVPSSTTDPLARIRAIAHDLPEAQQRVAKAIVTDPDWAVRAAVEEIARRGQVSAPTVVRFCRSLGYEGLSDFKLQLAQRLALGTPYLHRAVTAKDDTASLIHKILYGAAAVLTNLERQLDPAKVEQAIAKLAAARRVECFSVGMVSTFLANDAQSRFARLGLNANAYFDAHLQLVASAALSPRDIVLAISHVGRMPTLLEAVQLAHEQGATIIGITQPDTPLAQRCTIPLAIEVPEDAAMRVGTEAYLASQMLIEMLTVGVGLRLGRSAIERLKRVRAVLLERGVDTDMHPALHRAWSETDAVNE